MKVPITSRAANAQAHTQPATPVAPTPIAIPAAIPAAQENMLGRSTEEPAPNNRVSYARAWLNSCLCATQSRLAYLNPCNRDQRNLRAGYEPIIDAPIEPDSPTIDSSPAPHQRQHNAQWISNTGMLCDFYGMATINTAKSLMRTTHGNPTPRQESMVSSASLAGAALGQSLLGSLADKVGRKRASLISAGLSTCGALGCLFAGPWQQNPSSIYDVLTLARFIMGVGAGGDFPILASITAENTHAQNSANALIRNSMMAALGAMATQITYAALIPHTTSETAWRSAAGIAALMSIGTIIARQLLLPDSAAERNAPETANNNQMASDLEIGIIRETESDTALDTEWDARLGSGSPEHTPTPLQSPTPNSKNSIIPLIKPIAATAAAWTLFDFVDFSLSIYSSDILGSPSNLEQGALMTLALNSTAFIGALTAMQLVDPARLGRNNLQTLGFAGLGACHLMLAASAGHLWQDDALADGTRQVCHNSRIGRAAFLSLYGLQQLFDAVGPGVGVYLIPAEIFPTAMRSTCMGIAAATGKLGAVLGSATMPFIRDAGGLPTVFLITGILSTLGAVVTRQWIPQYGPNTLARLDETQERAGTKGVAELLYS